MNITEVILVDEKDEPVGVMEKMEAHQKGVLHRAFSVFLFNNKGEMLLQKRALGKYHSAGLWTNACCSHPAPGEEVSIAAHRRMKEELGIETPVTQLFNFVYQASFENGLTENEFDHVLVGEYEGLVPYNRDEVADYCYKTMPDIRSSLLLKPQQFTAWFQLVFPRIEEWWQAHYSNNINKKNY